VVVGRSPLITRLLVWALAIVAIDGVVIATRDDSQTQASRAATAVSTTTATTATGAGDASSAGDATSTTATDGDSTTATTDGSVTTVSTDSSTGGEKVVAELSGDGDTSTSKSFHVDGRWQLRWRVEPGGGVAAPVQDDDNHNAFAYVGMQPGQSSVEFPTGCSCTLELTPDGSAYDVLVVDVEG
jgi:hypothetical protein